MELDAYAQKIREEVSGVIAPPSEVAALDQLHAALKERLGTLGIEPGPETAAAFFVAADLLTEACEDRAALQVQSLGLRVLT